MSPFLRSLIKLRNIANAKRAQLQAWCDEMRQLGAEIAEGERTLEERERLKPPNQATRKRGRCPRCMGSIHGTYESDGRYEHWCERCGWAERNHTPANSA